MPYVPFTCWALRNSGGLGIWSLRPVFIVEVKIKLAVFYTGRNEEDVIDEVCNIFLTNCLRAITVTVNALTTPFIGEPHVVPRLEYAGVTQVP